MASTEYLLIGVELHNVRVIREMLILLSGVTVIDSRTTSNGIHSIDGFALSVLYFVINCCNANSEEKDRAKNLFAAYKVWCQQNGFEHLSQRAFGINLTTMGFERKRRDKGSHWWMGIGLEKKS